MTMRRDPVGREQISDRVMPAPDEELVGQVDRRPRCQQVQDDEQSGIQSAGGIGQQQAHHQPSHRKHALAGINEMIDDRRIWPNVRAPESRPSRWD